MKNLKKIICAIAIIAIASIGATNYSKAQIGGGISNPILFIIDGGIIKPINNLAVSFYDVYITGKVIGVLEIENDTWLRSIDNAGTGVVNMFKVTTGDIIQFGATVAGIVSYGAIDITIPDGGNDVGLTVTGNDTTNNPDTMSITTATTGNSLFIDVNSESISMNIDSEATTANGIYGDFQTMTSGEALTLVVDSDVLTGKAIQVLGGTDHATDVFSVSATGSVALADNLNLTDDNRTLSTSAGYLELNKDADAHVNLFAGAETGENRLFQIYGYASSIGVPAIKYSSMYVDTYGGLVFDTEESSTYSFDTSDIRLLDGNLELGRYTSDNNKIVFGNGADATIYYDGTDMIIDPKEVGSGRLKINGVYSSEVDADTIADSGDGNPATANLTPASSYVSLTCNDADTCDITLVETGAVDGQIVRITNVSANDCDFADTAGLTELAGAFAMGQYDTLELMYATDRFVEISRSGN